LLRHRGDVKWALPVAGVALLAASRRRDRAEDRRSVGSTVTFSERTTVMAERAASHATRGADPTGFRATADKASCSRRRNRSPPTRESRETVGNRYMPIGNLTQMTDGERALIATMVRTRRGDAITGKLDRYCRRQNGFRRFRASLFHFVADPVEAGERVYEFFDDGMLVLADGRRSKPRRMRAPCCRHCRPTPR
jgi:hypothetical protein